MILPRRKHRGITATGYPGEESPQAAGNYTHDRLTTKTKTETRTVTPPVSQYVNEANSELKAVITAIEGYMSDNPPGTTNALTDNNVVGNNRATGVTTGINN